MADPPVYSFEYPADWTEEIPTKTEKSTMVSCELLRAGQISTCMIFIESAAAAAAAAAGDFKQPRGTWSLCC
jgi:hypothetical protein